MSYAIELSANTSALRWHGKPIYTSKSKRYPTWIEAERALVRLMRYAPTSITMHVVCTGLGDA